MAVLLTVGAPTAHANMLGGLMRMVAGIFEVPRSTLAGTFGGPPIIGTVVGALNGTLRGLSMVAGGALETGVSSLRSAAKLVPFIPVFF